MTRLPEFIVAASRIAFLTSIAGLAPLPAEAQFTCPAGAGALADATTMTGSGGACYRFQVPAESPFVRLEVTAGGTPVDLYFSAGPRDALTDFDRVNPNPVQGDAKFVLLDPTAGEYTVGVAAQAPAGAFTLRATAAGVPQAGGAQTVCEGEICHTTLPMMRAAQSIELGVAYGDRVVFPVTVTGPGTIRVVASWGGSASRLALMLNGPNRPELSNPVAFYARTDGGTPLTLSYNVTQEDAARGQRFFVSLVNFSGGEASGDLRITKPRSFRPNFLGRPGVGLTRPGIGPRAETITCASQVQNKIAWNYSGSTRWNEANVERLCQGAVTSTQPATCFRRVMHGGIQWGGGTRWEWENAIDLCEGTLDAQQTIACFQGRIREGVTWQRAIRACETR